jgi:hypothetical protein
MIYVVGYLDKEYFVDLNYDDIKQNKYLISNYGNIMNKKTKRILKSFKYNGYIKIKLRTISGSKNFIVSRLVAHTFIANINEINKNLDVHHKNTIRDDNFYQNLEYLSPIKNIQIAFKEGSHKNKHNKIRLKARGPRPNTRIPKPYLQGEFNHKCINSSELIHEICKLLESGYSIKLIKKSLDFKDLSKSQIKSLLNSIKQKKTWHHITHLYEY